MTDLETESLKLAREYISLGGTRLSKLDDNIVSTRKWDDEPTEAAAFWANNIADLPEDKRVEVESHLPSMTDD